MSDFTITAHVYLGENGRQANLDFVDEAPGMLVRVEKADDRFLEDLAWALRQCKRLGASAPEYHVTMPKGSALYNGIGEDAEEYGDLSLDVYGARDGVVLWFSSPDADDSACAEMRIHLTGKEAAKQAKVLEACL